MRRRMKKALAYVKPMLLKDSKVVLLTYAFASNINRCVLPN